MTIAAYSDINTAVNAWDERAFTTAETDEFILIAEARANRRLARNWNRQATATVTTDATGYATLPTGFLGLVSIKQDVTGATPLKQVSWEAIDARNPYADADDAQVYAISGTQIRVSPVATDDFICVFDKKVAALSGTNTSNWLLALAPDYYLYACQGEGRKKLLDYQGAAVAQAMADGILEELVSQSNVAQWGNVEMTFDMVMP
jgi:hypothetical protein